MVTSSRSAKKTADAMADQDELAAQLRLMSARLARRMRRESQSGLTPSLSSALATIQAHGPMTPSALAAHERIARSGVSRLISRLETDELVETYADADDARSYQVRISVDGAELLERARARSRAFLGRALAGLNEREMTVLSEAVQIVHHLLDYDNDHVDRAADRDHSA